MVVERLIRERERRSEIFSNLDKHAKEVKKLAEKYFGNCKVYLFGSAVRRDYHVMLSDIDIAIVTDCIDRNRILRFKAEVSRKWDIFELHVVNEDMWDFYRRFIDKFKEV